MTFRDNYEWTSGWIHDYYCDKDGSELIFDLNNNNYFECPICNFKYTDEKRKRAWITKYRYKIFKLLENYSKEYLENKNKEIITFIVNALNYYSLNYDKFAIHNKDGEFFNTIINASNKCGRITAQGLNEAMISIQIVNCINNISLYLDDKTKKNVLDLLFAQIYELLKTQINKIHNICCYEICAIAMMGIISNNKEMLEFAFNSPYSFYNQLDKGITKDYFWFEGSFHYHFFVLKPILELLKLAKIHNFYIPEKYYNIGKMMLIQGFKCSFNDCSLPSPNDGWPNRHLSDYIEVYNLGNDLFSDEFSNIIEFISTKTNIIGTTHFIETGFSLLKNKYWNIFIKYKENNINHAHPDKLNIEIKNSNNFLTHDLATSGYGSNISKDFYKKSYSHNTIVIDGKNQNLECETIISSYSKNMIDVNTKNIYGKVNISRKIQLLSKDFIDEIQVDYCNNKNVDYFFHCDAKLITKLDFNTNISFEEYSYLKNIKEVNIKNDNITLKWSLNDKVIISKIDLKNKKLYICDSPGNPNLKNRTTLIIRSNNEKKASFKIEWRC